MGGRGEGRGGGGRGGAEGGGVEKGGGGEEKETRLSQSRPRKYDVQICAMNDLKCMEFFLSLYFFTGGLDTILSWRSLAAFMAHFIYA